MDLYTNFLGELRNDVTALQAAVLFPEDSQEHAFLSNRKEQKKGLASFCSSRGGNAQVGILEEEKN